MNAGCRFIAVGQARQPLAPMSTGKVGGTAPAPPEHTPCVPGVLANALPRCGQ